MKKTLLASSIIALTFTAASTSFAADLGSGTIEFKGTVNTGACTIAPTSVNKEVQLGSVPVASLQSAGAQGPTADFTLELKDCILDPEASGTDFSKVKVTFTGQMEPAGNLWANSGTAENIGVLFQNGQGNNLVSGDNVEQTLFAGSNTINLSARMQALGAAKAGTVKSTVAYVLDYQ
ncbi:fimbrial protein [Providencia sp.]|uniref:fimbrial protein n=1 Tax=Providencia sp. TaxID=589 RepID=UPI000E9A5CE5|nr:fimbrial protein [Providencia sp.]MBP6081480.1 fimbrial protein [Providencia sp.]HBO24379.1 fimbrial protein [Providencia sp.]